MAAGLALVLALLCLVLLYPLFLRLAWRPYRARAARALQRCSSVSTKARVAAMRVAKSA